MKVQCHISSDCTNPRAVLYVRQLTPAISEAVSLLENEGRAAATIYATRDGITYFLEPANLELVRTEGREIVGYDVHANRYRLTKPLYELENMLEERFVRISKSCLVNIRQIAHVSAGFNGTMRLVMKNGIEDYISRSFRRSFKERLGLL